MSRKVIRVWIMVFVCILASCGKEESKKLDIPFKIDFKKYELENGLQVILHQDFSDPIVAIAIQYGVGSNREKPGKTGFAHLFEHMLFQRSENVAEDQFFNIIQNLGGQLNGGTWSDGTIYYEVVPKNALETVLWLESDRMGYFINSVTKSSFINQQEVVNNEKRQRIDNRPYGYTSSVIRDNLYPKGHPYNWEVIGKLEDIKNSTLEDLKEFYNKYYGPNNATLVISGDFQEEHARELIEKYFGEIKKREEVLPLKQMPVSLSKTKRLYHEDNFAVAAQLNIVWPTVDFYNKDVYALKTLGLILSDGKKSKLYKVLVEDKKLTSQVSSYNNSHQLAGDFTIRITANSDVGLYDVEKAIFEALEKFENEGITDREVERKKVKLETEFYNHINSVLGKAQQLSNDNMFMNDPGFYEKEIQNYYSVSKEDIMRVYKKYIKGKPFILTSFVPKGKTNLNANNCVKASVTEEKFAKNIENKEQEQDDSFDKTATSFDRSLPPKISGNIPLNIPHIWNDSLSNGMKIYGVEHSELPLVNFEITLKGGHLLDNTNKNGVANLITDIMMEGTRTKTPEELEEEMEFLGAEIFMYTDNESIVIQVNTLSRNFEKTVALTEEILLEPRWDEKEFNRIKLKTINNIKMNDAKPTSIASKVFNKLIYGNDHIFSFPITGNVEEVENINIGDLKKFYKQYFSPSVSYFNIVGSVDKSRVLKALKSIEEKWKRQDVVIPKQPEIEKASGAILYFVNVPKAKQSVISIGNVTIPRGNSDFYPLHVANFKLGGSFNSNLNLILREEKGYTYGARSMVYGGTTYGLFKAYSSVRTNVTGESISIFRDQIKNYKEGISKDDLTYTKNSIIRSNARRFETHYALINMLNEISKYGLSLDYIKNEEKIVANMTLDKHKELINKYLDEKNMIYLVVGDASTQFEQFKKMNFDEVLLIDNNGNKIIN